MDLLAADSPPRPGGHAAVLRLRDERSWYKLSLPSWNAKVRLVPTALPASDPLRRI